MGGSTMELLKEVLIIEANGLKPTCFIVENLPKDLLFHKTKKLMQIDEYSERLVPAFVINEEGKKVPTGEMVDTLLSGIIFDPAGSGGYIFTRDTDDSIQALKKLDRYIEEKITNPALKPKRIPYAAIPGDTKSYPRPYNTIIRVRLPVPVSPPEAPTSEQAGALPARPKKVKTPEQVAAMKARLEKARAARAAKITQAKQVE